MLPFCKLCSCMYTKFSYNFFKTWSIHSHRLYLFAFIIFLYFSYPDCETSSFVFPSIRLRHRVRKALTNIFSDSVDCPCLVSIYKSYTSTCFPFVSLVVLDVIIYLLLNDSVQILCVIIAVLSTQYELVCPPPLPTVVLYWSELPEKPPRERRLIGLCISTEKTFII